MIDLNTARDRAKNYLLGVERRMNTFGSALPGYEDPQHRLVIVKEHDYDFGWVFCYDTKEYVETGDAEYAIAGNAPLIVDRADGQLYVTGTAYSLDHFIAEYRRGIRRRAEPGRPPNGGLATPLGNSGVRGGSPSVS
jgi:hypothetical protein